MITRLATLSNRLAIACAILFTLVACGGGGGGGGGGGFLPASNDSASLFLSLLLLDPIGNSTNTVTSTAPATLQVTVTSGGVNGPPVANEVVTAASGLAAILPEDGTALTNADGVATFQVESDGTQGADTLVVSVQGPDGPIENTINFQVAPAELRLGRFDGTTFVNGEINVSSDNLPRGGAAELTIFVVDADGDPVATEEVIRLRSDCARSGLAALPSTVTTENGRATFQYTSTGCDGDDTVTATLVGSSSTATVTVFVAPPLVNSIFFDSAVPGVIALKGTGGGTGLQETALVRFKVLDSNNLPQSGVEVNFGLTTDVGGLSLTRATDFSDADGFVEALVKSGNVATAVRITATIEAVAADGSILTLTTVSDVLAVTTGIPDQNSISISSEFLNVPGAREINGITSEITVRMGDKFNNPVPDGTAAVFTTEYGSIDGSCITANGACSVTWRSQSPRLPTFNADLVRRITDANYNCPSHNANSGPCPDDLGYIRGLRTTILVTAVGEEFFVDQNGNGLYDEDEPFENLAEAFIDHNEDGRFTPVQGCVPSNARCEAAGAEETFTDFDGDGQFSFNVDPINPNGVFNGILCPEQGDGIWCSRELVNVRDEITLIMGSLTNFAILLVNSSGNPVGTTEQGSGYVAYIADIFNNRPPGGITISLSADDSGAPEGADPCEIIGETSFPVADSNARGAFAVPVSTQGIGTVTISVDGGENTSSATYGCNAPFDPNDAG